MDKGAWYRAPRKRLYHRVTCYPGDGYMLASADMLLYDTLCGDVLPAYWYDATRWESSPPFKRCCKKCLAAQEAQHGDNR